MQVLLTMECLNDFIYKGPKLQRNVFDILCRFRRLPIAFACDVSEMYLQIELEPTDRKFTRFLWRNMEDRQPDIYELNRLTFGINSCPFQAQFVTQINAIINQSELQIAADAVLQSTYMDDTLDSVENEKMAKCRQFRSFV